VFGALLFAACSAAPARSAEDRASAVTASDAVTYPIIAVACEAFVDRASTFDCASAHAVVKGSVAVDPALPSLDKTIRIRNAYLALSRQATEDCGGPALCRGAYGVIGEQCIAIAQSEFFAGFGSFEGKEATREEAEATAVHDCEVNVGDPGAACRVVISECPDGSDL
jgi:hypothetical protein